jgi:hypothetical protein
MAAKVPRLNLVTTGNDRPLPGYFRERLEKANV